MNSEILQGKLEIYHEDGAISFHASNGVTLFRIWGLPPIPERVSIDIDASDGVLQYVGYIRGDDARDLKKKMWDKVEEMKQDE